MAETTNADIYVKLIDIENRLNHVLDRVEQIEQILREADK